MTRKQHWDAVYTTKTSEAVSWFQPEATISARLIEAAGVSPET
jgi:hypothetical protein